MRPAKNAPGGPSAWRRGRAREEPADFAQRRTSEARPQPRARAPNSDRPPEPAPPPAGAAARRARPARGGFAAERRAAPNRRHHAGPARPGASARERHSKRRAETRSAERARQSERARRPDDAAPRTTRDGTIFPARGDAERGHHIRGQRPRCGFCAGVATAPTARRAFARRGAHEPARRDTGEPIAAGPGTSARVSRARGRPDGAFARGCRVVSRARESAERVAAMSGVSRAREAFERVPRKSARRQPSARATGWSFCARMSRGVTRARVSRARRGRWFCDRPARPFFRRAGGSRLAVAFDLALPCARFLAADRDLLDAISAHDFAEHVGDLDAMR
jgi:hypothetical protein